MVQVKPLYSMSTGVYAPSSGRVMFSMGDKEIELSKLISHTKLRD